MKTVSFLNVCKDVTSKASKIPVNQYLSSGLYPIFDQGKKEIGGYTNDQSKVLNDFPYILFGDHTRIFKFIECKCYIGADGVKLLKVYDKNFLPKYVYYSLLSYPIEDHGYSRHFKYLKQAKIIFRSKTDQELIVSELDNISESIRSYKLLYLLIDELVKSRFIEVVSSTNQRVQLNDLCLEKPEYGAQSAAIPFDTSRPRYIRITDINDDGSLNDDMMCSSNSSDDLKYKLSSGDILFARTGATVGKTYLGSSKNEIFAGYLIRFRLDIQKILPEFLFCFTKTDEYWNWVKIKQSGSGQPGINAQKYSTMSIPLPSISIQQSFVSFYKQVDKLKFIVQQQIEDLTELFNKKIDEYFDYNREV